MTARPQLCCYRPIDMLCLFCYVFAHEFLLNPHFYLEPDYIIRKGIRHRIQRCNLHREILSTFHTRVNNWSACHFCIVFTPKLPFPFNDHHQNLIHPYRARPYSPPQSREPSDIKFGTDWTQKVYVTDEGVRVTRLWGFSHSSETSEATHFKSVTDSPQQLQPYSWQINSKWEWKHILKFWGPAWVNQGTSNSVFRPVIASTSQYIFGYPQRGMFKVITNI